MASPHCERGQTSLNDAVTMSMSGVALVERPDVIEVRPNYRANDLQPCSIVNKIAEVLIQFVEKRLWTVISPRDILTECSALQASLS